MSKKEITLSDKFAGITLSRSKNGALTVDVSSLNGVDVTVITNGNGKVMNLTPVEAQTNEAGVTGTSVDKRAYNVGDVLPDGWVVGPVSPTTGQPMAIEPVSGALGGYKTWDKGDEHAKTLRAQGHAGVRQPDADELNALYNGIVEAGRNQNAQFDTSGFTRGGCINGGYWSSTRRRLHSPDYMMVRCFGGEGMGPYSKGEAVAHVRCVRDEIGLTLS